MINNNILDAINDGLNDNYIDDLVSYLYNIDDTQHDVCQSLTTEYQDKLSHSDKNNSLNVNNI